VIHRDIKPDNILVDTQTGRAMVTDFGIARATNDGETRLTATGTAIGTPAYMSPEQCAGDRQLDGRSDLYSLGAVAYYAITGRPPFEGTSTPAIMMKQVTEQPAPLRDFRRDLPEDLDRIVMKLLEKDPVNRFPDGASVVAALDGERVDPPAQTAGNSYPFGKMNQMPTLAPMAPVYEPIPGFNARMAARQARWEASQKRHDQHRLDKEARENARPLPDRIRSFRRRLASYVGTTTFLFGINAVTGGDHVFWWAAFPALGMAMGLFSEGGSLWAAGARLRDVFGSSRQLPQPPSAAMPAPAAKAIDPGQPNVSQEVLNSSRGAVLRQAFADRNAIDALVKQLSETDRKQIPDAAATASGLYDRVQALASTLHRLDSEIGNDRLDSLDQRIRDSEAGETSADRDRMQRLLKRQRETLANLVKSRDTLSEQYESAGLLLQNLKLDLIRMRSSGLQAGLADVTSVTQEARALSKEIGYVLAANDELRDI
jgi:serine/threonine-protein kinase